MRNIAIHSPTPQPAPVPRGWFVVGAALASWVIVAVIWTVASQVGGLAMGLL